MAFGGGGLRTRQMAPFVRACSVIKTCVRFLSHGCSVWPFTTSVEGFSSTVVSTSSIEGLTPAPNRLSLIHI